MAKRWTSLIQEWTARVTLDCKYHESLSLKFDRRHKLFGYPAAILAGFTSLFGVGMSPNSNPSYTIALLVSICTTILTALLTFGDFQKRHQHHVDQVKRCRDLMTELSFRRKFVPNTRDAAFKVFDEIKRLFSDIEPRLERPNMGNIKGLNPGETQHADTPAENPAELGPILWKDIQDIRDKEELG